MEQMQKLNEEVVFPLSLGKDPLLSWQRMLAIKFWKEKKISWGKKKERKKRGKLFEVKERGSGVHSTLKKGPGFAIPLNGVWFVV